ncbi:MAG: DUF6089 family protein [Prolixibacteraceae bacterium]
MGRISGKIFFSMLLISCFLSAKPQKALDVGILAGAATYWGDIDQVDYGQAVTPLYGLIARYNFNPRIAVRGQLLTGKLQAAGIFPGANLAEYIPDVQQYENSGKDSYNFSRSIQTLEAIFEFNFMAYQSGSLKKNRFTPFLSLGLGCLYSRAPSTGTLLLMPQPIPPDPNIVPPGPILYDAVQVDGKNTNAAAILAPTIPVGFGIKYNLTKRLGVCAEICVRKTFTDNIDNLKDPGKYQFPASNVDNSMYPSPDQFVPSVLYNNDWFASVNVSLHWQIWTDKGICKVMDDKNSYYGKKSGF